MNNILVVGANGQLGRCLYDICPITDSNVNYIFKSHNELDITSQEDIDKIFDETHYDYVVNCAAYTNVEKAEDDIKGAERVNSYGVKLLGESCLKHNSKLIHVSTEYVFDGIGFKNEYDLPNPLNSYGKSKYNGEQELIKLGEKNDSFEYIIIRTSWLYSKYGKNFVKAIYNRILKGEEFSVVGNQVGSPTSAINLARCIITIIKNCIENKSNFHRGVYHYSDDGVISRYDFAKAIEEFIDKTSNLINPCLTGDFPSKVNRPISSIWSKEELKKNYNIKFEYWKTALYKVLSKIS